MRRPGLRLVLGAIWLLDGVLQLQPGMWSMDMVVDVIKPSPDGPPAPIQALLVWAQQSVAAHPYAVNAGVAGIQLLLGVALLCGFSPRAALVASMAWTLVVWVFGEGLGRLLTGSTVLGL
jgi:uncharacterized membrane protein YphA (DoxX/SURF4 family)